VLLQDRAQHIGEAVDGCRRSLTTMHSVMLPRNPLPGTFPQLLAAFRSTQQIHHLIELNLVAGTNFALGWTRKWHPRLNFISMSLGLPSGGALLRVYMDATLQPARRLIARFAIWNNSWLLQPYFPTLLNCLSCRLCRLSLLFFSCRLLLFW
jgi:hypothetical protein